MNIADLQHAMSEGALTAEGLALLYLERIAAYDKAGPRLNAVIEVNPDALAIARALDAERREGHVRGPLHGIPILLKDNIDTGDRMQTTAGSLALVGAPAPQDATVARRLRDAGAVILGKTNLSEWANFRSTHSVSGWSGRGRRTRNPYALDRNPSGSSSGSAVAVSASLAAAALGTETDGSITSPANANGVVGIKPTVGLTSRAGVIPISHSQDTVGPHARSVADAAVVLAAIAGNDPRDPATTRDAGRADATAAAVAELAADLAGSAAEPDGQALRGVRLGVAREGFWGYSEKADVVIEEALRVLSDLGAEIVDPADLPSTASFRGDSSEMAVLLYELKDDLNAYLASRTGLAVHSLAELIAWNRAHAAAEMPFFGQELFELAEARALPGVASAAAGQGSPAQSSPAQDPPADDSPARSSVAPGSLTDEVYREALARSRRLGGEQGIDAVLQRYRLDAIVAPTGGPAWVTDMVNGDCVRGGSAGPAARAGYPIVTVPAGVVTVAGGVDSAAQGPISAPGGLASGTAGLTAGASGQMSRTAQYGLPVNISFIGTAWSEPRLIRIAYEFEQATRARRAPRFLPSISA